MRKRVGRASFEDADVALEQALEELDVNVPNYNEWLRSLLEPAAHGRVIELGAGVGTFTVALLETASHVVAVEPSARQGAALVESTAHDNRITPIIGYAPDAIGLGPFDGAVLSNVLEHIDDDEATLREMFEMLKPSGTLAVFSPAFELLMSNFDRSIGHVRRYRKRDLVQRFERAGFEVTEARYVNMPGFLAWLLIARLGKQRPTGSRLSGFYDQTFVSASRWLESKVRAPFGQSVLVIGRVPKSMPKSTTTTTTESIDAADVVVGG